MTGITLFDEADIDGLDQHTSTDGMCFYLGSHHPSWLGWARWPLFVSHRALAPITSPAKAVGPYAIDSGGFTELSKYGEWRTPPQAYVEALARYEATVGRMDWAAPQDWMCEPFMLAKTGLTVREHQARTVDNFQTLRALWPKVSDESCPVMPVLQGWTLGDYEHCADLYAQAGVDLHAYELVGLGSVCRRQDTAEIGAIVAAFAAEFPLHGFGCKTSGLVRYGRMLASADSMAWSFDGRFKAGCTPTHVSEANCPAFAEGWRQRLHSRAGLWDCSWTLGEVEDSPLARVRACREVSGYRGPSRVPPRRPAEPESGLFEVAA